MPERLVVYRESEWGAPPWEGSGAEWAAGHIEAYRRFEAAQRAWFDEFGHLPVDLATPVPDEPFCGEFGPHDCDVPGCVESGSSATRR
jgi:hypothetical protein